jgi:hypothetical protein
MNVSMPDGTGGLYLGTAPGQPGYFVNAAAGTVNVTNGADFRSIGLFSDTEVSNAGTWNVSTAGAAISSIEKPFNNTGTVNVTAGTFQLSGGGTNTASMTVATGATLRFAGGTYDHNSGSVLNLAGKIATSAGVCNFNAGSYNFGATEVTGGAMNFNAAAIASDLALSSGTLGGTAAVSVTGNLLWTGGTMEGTGSTTVAGAASTIFGVTDKFLNRTLTNTGTMNVSMPDGTGGLYLGTALGQPGYFVNATAGTVNVTNGADFRSIGFFSDTAVDNAGTWNVSTAGAAIS